jgi:autotransporter-associated beta strand protein
MGRRSSFTASHIPTIFRRGGLENSFAPVAGVYNMSTTSDDGSEIFIDGASVVDNNMYQGMTNRGGSVFLQPGLHDIVIGFYEGGGGAGIQVFVAPPGGASQILTNSSLFTTGGTPTFANPIDIQQDSTVRNDYFAAVASDLTIQPGKKLTTEGSIITATNLKMRTSGSYTINTSGASNTLVASKIDDNAGAAALTINKTGAGLFVLDNTTTAQLTNAANVININEGSLGILLETGGLSPTGNAAINFTGGGIVLSSKGGNQTYPLPVNGFGGVSPVVEARQIGSGVPGPVTVTLGGNLKIPSTQTLGLKSSNGYSILLGGTADLSGGIGTLSINGGQVTTTTPNAINGLNLAFNPTEPATLRVTSNAVTLNSLASSGSLPATLIVGTGTGAATLTVNGALTTAYSGAINQATGTVASLVKTGTGKQTISGSSNFSGGVTINSGTLTASGAALGTGTVTLAGGTLQAIPSGLLGEYWDSSRGGDTNAQPGFSGDLGAFNAYFAGKGNANVSAPTTTGGRINLKFSTGVGLDGGGPDTATFADQGFMATNNMAIRLSGTIYLPVAGDYVFTTRSDDGSVVYIDGVKAVDNNLYQGMTTLNGPPITLIAGTHTISVGFYEGGGGSGLEVRYTIPGGQDQFIGNNVLGGLHSTNPVTLTTSSTIDPAGGFIDLGALTLPPVLTLTGLDGNINFTGTTLTGAGGSTYNINKSAGVLNLGNILDGGNAVVINKTGAGSLLLATPTAAQLTNAASVVNVNAGSVVAVASSGLNPLGVAPVNLNGGGLIVSSSEATASFPNTVNVTGASSLGAGNLGGGAIDAASVTVTKPLSVSGGASLALSTTNGYTLNLGTISGGGNLSMTGGQVNTNGPVTAGVVTVSGPTPVAPATIGGVLQANNSFTATSVTINSSGALHTAGPVTASGGITVNATGELQTAGGTINAPINLAGGILRAQSGITDLGTSVVTFAAPSVTNNAIRGVLHLTTGEFAPSVLPGNSDAGILGTQLRAPDATINLTGPVTIPNNAAGDGSFSTLFNKNAGGQRFTAGFFGRLTAPENGLYQFQVGTVDDLGGFWVDLDRNGVFESTGSAGNELISGQGCCGDGPVGQATLVAGQTYNIAFAVEDTGGDSGLSARFKRPADAALIPVNPGDAGQAGLWSAGAATSGGAIIVEAGAELRASRLDKAGVVTLTGAGAKLRLSSTSAVTDAVDGLSAIIGGGAGTLELGANNTVNAASLTVTPTGTLIKTGAGTLTAASQSIGEGGILQVDGGTVNLNGTVGAFNGNAPGTASSGSVVVNATGLVNVNGSITGAVTLNNRGTLSWYRHDRCVECY